MIDAWRLFPHTFARKVSHKRFQLYNHTVYLSELLAQAIAQGNARIIVSIPPRHGKSELISKYLPLWYLENFPDKHVILTSYSIELASYFSRWVRNEFEQNEMLKTKLKKDSQAAYRFDTTQGGSMLAAGVGGPITGRGSSLAIIDDPIKNYEEANSPRIRQAIKDWFNSTLYTRLEPNASLILIMTRWHHDDLAGYLAKEHQDPWQLINLPALAEENDPIGRKLHEPLCPERYNLEALLNIKQSLPDNFWNALYQQRPTNIEGQIFHRSWWQYYHKKPEAILSTVQFWDTAQKPGLTNDFSVCATWARTTKGYFLIDIFRKKLEAPDLEIQVVAQYNKFRPNQVVIEDKSSGSSIIQYIRRNTTIPIIPYDPKTKDKITRAINATPLIKSGNVFLPKDAPWLADFLKEHDEFPNSTHDDQVDTTSQMAEHFNNLVTYQPRITFL